MPIYVFVCPQCQVEKEVLRSFSAMEDTEYCEACPKPAEQDGVKMQRVSFPGGSTFHLKGRGWAKDNYK